MISFYWEPSSPSHLNRSACSYSIYFSWELLRLSQAPSWDILNPNLFFNVGPKGFTGTFKCKWKSFKTVASSAMAPNHAESFLIPQHSRYCCHFCIQQWIQHWFCHFYWQSLFVLSSIFIYWDKTGMFQERERQDRAERMRDSHQHMFLILIQNSPYRVLTIID